MKRTLSILVSLLLLLALLGVAAATGGCALVDPFGPDTTAPIPDDPRVKAVVAVLRPSVVEVRASSSRGALVQEIGLGTGVIVRSDGVVVTNDHVITLGGDLGDGDESPREPADRIEIRLEDGTRLQAQLVGRAPGYDLAFLDVEAEGLPVAERLTDLDDVEVGGLAVAIGAAANLVQPVTVGQVTEVLDNVRSRSLPELTVLIRSNVPLTQGNSGGPLADEYARVMGINVAVTMGNGGSREEEGASLAIPSTVVLQALAELEEAWAGGRAPGD
jgi:S1-C subfamily serine protease